MIRNLVFDVGNVLTTFAWPDHYKDHGLEGATFEKVADATTRSPLWGETDRGIFTHEEFIELLTKNAPAYAKEIRDVLSDLHGLVRKRDYAIPWMQELKAKGLHLYFLSNFSEKAYADCADALDFEEFMDGGIWSYREKIVKPDPAIYKLLLERYHLKAEETLFLDDSAPNVYVAEMCGLSGLVFTTKEVAEQKMREMGIL